MPDWAAGEYQLCPRGRSELGCTGEYDFCRNPVSPEEIARRFALRYPKMVPATSVSFQPDDRVLVKPLGVKGTVLRKAAAPGFFVIQADNGGKPVSWLWRELEKPSTD
jgi:hypothetical protein